MVETSTAEFTDSLAFTICRAFELCEIAEYDQAGESLPFPDQESSDGELLFVWGVIASGQGRQEQAKDLLSKAARILKPALAELARVYLSVCYWRLGEDSSASILLDIEPSDLQAKFCWLMVRMMIEAEQRNWNEALALLEKAEPFVERVSIPNQGKFFNHRGLAFRNLGEYDRALIDFESACSHWQDAPKLRALALNNTGRLYSLTGELDKALACVDEAISLVDSRQLLGQFYDQRSIILLEHGLTEQAEIESRKAISYLAKSERVDYLNEALETCNRAAKQTHCQMSESVLSSSSPEQFRSQRGGCEPLTLERATQLIDAITTENDGEHAWEIIELLAKTADPNSEIAQQTMRRLFTLTEEFEEEYARQMQRFISPENQSQAEN